jgi:muramidase (phage lysozyme)
MAVSQYDPTDPIQQNFLSALALGESGNAANAYTLGAGGTDLSQAPTDASGFPQWSGVAGSRAAGAFQFQPGTWTETATPYNLHFQNPSDQNDAAWILAQQTYGQATGQDLETALKAGDFQTVQAALAGRWKSVTGNQAAPQGLAYDLANGIGANIASAGAPSSSAGGPGSYASSAGGAGPADFIGAIESFFVRFGLIIAGGAIVFVALWQLLSEATPLPSPAATAKAAGKAARRAPEAIAAAA